MGRVSSVKRNRSMIYKNIQQWEKAIQDAKTQLQMAQERAARLTEIVADLEKMKAAGEPWPTAGKK